MVTKKEVVEGVLVGLKDGETLTLADAVAKANVAKPLKNAKADAAWRIAFQVYGTVTETETGATVGKKPVVVA